jgi:predicted component of type VI protein secretion system
MGTSGEQWRVIGALASTLDERIGAMSASLVLIKHNGEQVDVALKHPKTIIGRHTDCQIRIPDVSVSRQHCELSVTDGRVVIRDLGSSNGTFVNRRRISSTELAPADLINVGKFIFVIRIDGKPEAIDSEDSLEDGMATQAPAVVQTPAPKPASKPAPKPVPQPANAKSGRGSLTDPNADSSVVDFDFLDEKDAPKL